MKELSDEEREKMIAKFTESHQTFIDLMNATGFATMILQYNGFDVDGENWDEILDRLDDPMLKIILEDADAYDPEDEITEKMDIVTFDKLFDIYVD